MSTQLHHAEKEPTISEKDIAGLDNGFSQFKSLCNSPLYLHGIPTWFISLSAADLHRIELLKCLPEILDEKSLTDEEVAQLSFRENCRLVDGVTRVRYYKGRVQVFIHDALYDVSQPIGPDNT